MTTRNPPEGSRLLDTGRDAIEAHAFADALADAYGLRVVGLSPLAGGSLNTGYRVAATDGDFHLKRYDGRICQDDHIHRSLEAQEYAGRSGIPVPALRPNVWGDAVTDVPGVGSVVLSTFIHGAHRHRGAIPATAAGAMGRMLGTLQQVLAPFEEPGPTPSRRRPRPRRAWRRCSGRRSANATGAPSTTPAAGCCAPSSTHSNATAGSPTDSRRCWRR